ncbi:hypothetical protein CC1G_02981 [Coprinopsis cinerea okayama7|uniref:DRBM domain-containing protein n=1 Tax=Coprinopsis cinerea (strain Okayama-7 / 130 / ATCC MYA-4618 / FGSC 9003) TaxID=240176 RepID=A8NRZ2_COPC7|nr:hypothetical protein CC1G_02981 [Coprinopsis cinerea okayama7\|eukprot:XP_001835893.1 hypothetical protein CC1G_02981 [Coprinopsis cinerea okayama7\
MANLPPLPKIEGDVELLLDVFTHKSLRMTGAPLNEDYGDTDRLAELGAYVLQMVVATHWFHAKNPSLPADQLSARIKESLSDTTVDTWMNAYGLKTKLRIAPSEMERSMNSSTEMRKVFETYVGAVYFRNRNGLKEIQQWISRLIDPNGATAILEDMPTHRTASPPVPSSPPAAQRYVPMQFAPPPQPMAPPPPMPPGTPYGRGPTGFAQGAHGMHTTTGQGHVVQQNLVTVALMNQKAAQNGVHVTYPAEQSGPPHAPLWHVRCCLNGKEYGRGTGRSQKIAKEEAARQAWTAMGWHQ